MFTGYAGSYLNELYYSPQFPSLNYTRNVNTSQYYDSNLNFSSNGNTLRKVVENSKLGFELWTTTDTLGDIGSRMAVLHSEDSDIPECIWVFVGQYGSYKIYCYNLTTEKSYLYDTWSDSLYNIVHRSEVMIITENTTYLIFATTQGHIRKYDIIAKELTYFQNSDDVLYLSRV